jgi:cation:H+ antiporter
MLDIILLLVGFAVLIKGADLLVEGASSLARSLKISDLVVGLTIVSFGTSTPELFVNLFASLRGQNEIAVGNILGSNIANILLILGVSAIIYPLTVPVGTVWKEIPFSLLAAVMLLIQANDIFFDGAPHSVLSRSDGLVLLSFFIIFMYYVFTIARRTNHEPQPIPAKQLRRSLAILMILIGLVGLVIGGKWIVDGAVFLATLLHMSPSFIGFTIVALGTSLPELATSVVAALKKNPEIAVGNVVGSNIFNIFFILGTSALINPIEFAANNFIDIGLAILASFFLFCCMFTGTRHLLDRWKGIFFVSLYGLYLVFLVIRG